jgi:hypothetical protein
MGRSALTVPLHRLPKSSQTSRKVGTKGGLRTFAASAKIHVTPTQVVIAQQKQSMCRSTRSVNGVKLTIEKTKLAYTLNVL